jgi:hypothetical protein
MEDRRRNVRVQTAPDKPLRAVLATGTVTETLPILNVSLSGIGFLCTDLNPVPKVGDDLALTLEVPGLEPFEVVGRVRHVGNGPGGSKGGLELMDLSDDQRSALKRYVGEMLARGLSV